MSIPRFSVVNPKSGPLATTSEGRKVEAQRTQRPNHLCIKIKSQARDSSNAGRQAVICMDQSYQSSVVWKGGPGVNPCDTFPLSIHTEAPPSCRNPYTHAERLTFKYFGSRSPAVPKSTGSYSYHLFCARSQPVPFLLVASSGTSSSFSAVVCGSGFRNGLGIHCGWASFQGAL